MRRGPASSCKRSCSTLIAARRACSIACRNSTRPSPMLLSKIDHQPVLTREELLQRAQALAPVLQERADAGEKLRRCPDETVEDFVTTGLLRICQPARYGGYELGYD